MAKFNIDVEYYAKYKKSLTIYADSDDEAEQKALELVTSWNNVTEDIEPEVVSIAEE